MIKKEIADLQSIYDQEIVKYSDAIFKQLIDYTDDDCFVELTEDILKFLDESFEDYGVEWVEDYSSSIGEIVFIAYYGAPIFPLDELKERLKGEESPEDYLAFYTLFSSENIVVESTSNKRGFLGIIDTFSHVEYSNFEDLFIYSALKLKNLK